MCVTCDNLDVAFVCDICNSTYCHACYIFNMDSILENFEVCETNSDETYYFDVCYNCIYKMMEENIRKNHPDLLTSRREEHKTEGKKKKEPIS